MKAPKKERTATAKTTDQQLYSLEVTIVSSPPTAPAEFYKKNRVVSRTIAIRGDQTLHDLHLAIFDAFDRFDDHLYEFQFGKKPQDRKAPRYTMPLSLDDPWEDAPPKDATKTTIDQLHLKTKQTFFYWFDFGDDWWHRLQVKQIEPAPAEGKFPQVVERVGESPPQYPDSEDDGDDDDDDDLD